MSKSFTDLDLAAGDRIELVSMKDDPAPIRPGATGRVLQISPFLAGHIVSMQWDDGRTLGLTLPYDKYKIIERTKE